MPQEGWLWERRPGRLYGSTWLRRWCEVNGGRLRVYDANKAREVATIHIRAETTRCDRLTADEVRRVGRTPQAGAVCFRVVDRVQGRGPDFAAESEEDAARWISAITPTPAAVDPFAAIGDLLDFNVPPTPPPPETPPPTPVPQPPPEQYFALVAAVVAEGLVHRDGANLVDDAAALYGFGAAELGAALTACGWTLDEWSRGPEYADVLDGALADGEPNLSDRAMVLDFERERGVTPWERTRALRGLGWSGDFNDIFPDQPSPSASSTRTTRSWSSASASHSRAVQLALSDVAMF